MGDDKTERRLVLEEAAELIDGDRQDDYGAPEINFQRIASLWNVVHPLPDGDEYLPSDVALMLALVKVGRLIQSPLKRDSWVDLAGYAALGWEVS